MSEPLRLHFGNGLVTNRDPSVLNEGELQQAKGCEYRVGTPHLYKIPGRTLTGNNLEAVVRGVHIFQYDVGDDKIVAVANGKVWESASTPSTSPSMAATGLTTLTAAAIPSFTGFRDRWLLCNGSDPNYLREPAAVPISGWSLGCWRKAGMLKPSMQPVCTVLTDPSNIQHVASAVNGNYTNNANVYDSSYDTYAYATRNTVGTTVEIYRFADDGEHDDSTGRFLRVQHSGVSGGDSLLSELPDYKLDMLGIEGFTVVGKQKIEVTYDYDQGSPDWITLEPVEISIPYTKRSSVWEIPDTDSRYGNRTVLLYEHVAIRVTTTLSSTDSAGDLWLQGRVFAAGVDTGAGATALTTDNPINYYYTERYYDSDEALHESNASPASADVELSDEYGVSITLPGDGGKKNAFATHYAIYRTLDTDGGGYPYLYLVDEVPISTTAYSDNFAKSLTSAVDFDHLYETLTVLYPDGSSLSMPINTPPPPSKVCRHFQGSMVYVPVDSDRIYYSIPATITIAGLEQVPELYYLQFVTETNDTVKTVCASNSGKSLVVYFERYSMLVNYLPQATDPGVFDTRVTEYVSHTRGTLGTHSCAEIDAGAGRTLAASVDALGVWVTDGVSMVQEWSNDLNWAAIIATMADVTKVRLINNPEMRRLEMYYEDTGGTWQVYYFFYGRMKQGSDGYDVPLITGPTPVGICCVHYGMIGGAWEGLSGAAKAISEDYDLYLERSGTNDQSQGYNASGHINYDVKTGDMYVGGLGKATIIVFGYPKFAGSSTRLLSDGGMSGIFRRDGFASANIKAKTYNMNAQKLILWNAYGDRHTFRLQDATALALEALVGYEVEVRDAGRGKD